MTDISGALVLAAGLGTRLRPLTRDRPKALVPIGDRPALGHVLEGLAGALPAVRLVVNAHDRAARIRAFALGWSAFAGRDLAVSEEPDLLGTAGALYAASDALGPGDVLAHNADVFAAIDLAALARSHGAHAAAATLVVSPRAPGQGPLGVDHGGRVVRIRDASVAPEASGAEFLGVQVIGRALRDRLPARGGLVEDVYIPALRAGLRLATFVHAGAWFDVGTPPAYVAANAAWLAARGVRSWVAPGVEAPAGVEFVDTLVGAGAQVDGAGVLAACVVWPGTRVVAPLRDRVVTPWGTLVAAPAAPRGCGP